jgi:hypothetical protein
MINYDINDKRLDIPFIGTVIDVRKTRDEAYDSIATTFNRVVNNKDFVVEIPHKISEYLCSDLCKLKIKKELQCRLKERLVNFKVSFVELDNLEDDINYYVVYIKEMTI